MSQILSEGIQIDTVVAYQPHISNPMQSRFLFAYRVMFKNLNDFSIRIHSRRLQLFDGSGKSEKPEDKVVARTRPVIDPGKTYEYISGCEITSGVGKLTGSFLVENLSTKKTFRVEMPSIEMIAADKNN